VVLCSGKHYYSLDEHRRKARIRDTAIVRVELLCPLPSGYTYEELQRYTKARGMICVFIDLRSRHGDSLPSEFIWSQEKPQNVGAWSFMEPRFRKPLINCNVSSCYRENTVCS